MQKTQKKLLKDFAKYWISLILLGLPAVFFAQEKVVVDSVVILGLEKTKEKVITRELTFQTGDTILFSTIEAVVKKNKNNLYNLGLFNDVKFNYRTDGNSVVFEIVVIERWYIWPVPYLALEERTFNEWWADKDLDRLVYGMGISWNNFSGMNDPVHLYLQGGYSRRITAVYNRPFLFPKKKLNGSFGFRYLNNKEVGYSTKGGILQLARLTDEPMRKTYLWFATISKRFSPRKFLHLTLDYQVYNPNDSIVFFNDKYLTTAGNTEYYPTLALNFQNDQRDLKSFPLDGYKYVFQVKHSGAPGIATTYFTKFSASFSQHIPLGKRFNFAYGSENHFMLGHRVPYYDKLFIGWTAMVRGYEPYVIDGSFISINKAEFKFAVFPRKILHVKQIPFRKFDDFPLGVYLSLYGDAGFVTDQTFNNLDPTLKDRMLLGYGAGINLITFYDTLLRIEVSRNLLGQTGIYLNTILPIR